MMKKFVKGVFVFLSIALLYVGVGEFFLFRLKETMPIEMVTDIQSSTVKELYYGRKLLGNSMSNYKFTMLRKTQPKILVLGQSVTLQFRDFMFEPYHDDFYNTGLMVRNIQDIDYVLTLFESGEIETPEMVLLAVDFSLVLENSFLDGKAWVQDLGADPAWDTKSHFQAMQKVYLNARTRRVPKEEAGFGKAGMEGRGYRNDGSYRHKPEIEKYVEDATYYDGNLIEKLHSRNLPFRAPMNFDLLKAQKVFGLLERFENLGIELILYIPPYSDTFFSQAIQDEMFINFWGDYMDFQNQLQNLGYNVIPFCTPSQIGLKDDYIVDAEHPGEVFCAIQLRNFVMNTNPKGKLVNTLSFETVNELLESELTIPISFLKDSISVNLRKH